MKRIVIVAFWSYRHNKKFYRNIKILHFCKDLKEARLKLEKCLNQGVIEAKGMQPQGDFLVFSEGINGIGREVVQICIAEREWKPFDKDNYNIIQSNYVSYDCLRNIKLWH